MKLLTAAFGDPNARSVAVRLTLASVLAMAVATALSLPNPWWAAMAVWMIGQPSRGLLLERSLAQFIGSLLGASAGVVLVLPWIGSPATPVLGLAVWIAACCGIANLMRHQRAYGAALCGLTSAVVVALTLGTSADPVHFATARILDTAIGIGSAVTAALLLGPRSPPSTIANRARTVTLQALGLITEALAQSGSRSLTRERAFLLALASLEASAEDAAAGSFTSRRKLKELQALFAFLLDLLVVARAIQSREAPIHAPGHAEIALLREALAQSASDLRARGGDLDVQAIINASEKLEAVDPVLSPLLQEMRAMLVRIAAGYRRVIADASEQAPRWSMPHPDISALRLAMLRGGLAVSLAGLAWLAIGWDPLRYLVLGAGIFTVLFSAMDEPIPAVRQVLTGGLAAAGTALLWRTAVLPEVGSGWLSLVLAVPLIFAASLLQARQGSLFLGLAFNMLFAVLARPVDMGPTSALDLLAIEVMLLCGIAVTYGLYRWLLPMSTKRRRDHLTASIRKEIAAIATRFATPWAARHLARLRYLVFNVAVRSDGSVHRVEDALAALSLGHALFRLGELARAPGLSDADYGVVRRALRLMAAPISDPNREQELLRLCASHVGTNNIRSPTARTIQSDRVRWLLGLAADDLRGHASLFASPVRGRGSRAYDVGRPSRSRARSQ